MSEQQVKKTPAVKQPRQDMPRQDPMVRKHNFSEVALGYTEEMALREASRCIECKKQPCSKGCPVNVDIPAFISLIKQKDYPGAINKIKETNSLPAVCGRVCPQEDQCEKYCTLGIKGESVAIGRLERFVADAAMAAGKTGKPALLPATGKKAAVVGSGPSGLAVAGDLIKKGHQVTIFEALHKAGGVLVYGIPEFRLPKQIVQTEVDYVAGLGAEVKCNFVVGLTMTVDELMTEAGFDAVYLGNGAGLPYFMNIPGENFNGVYSANEFLTRSNLMKAYSFPGNDTPIKVGKKVAVVGGGNVAMDSARTAIRLGAEEVYIVYRRSHAELPARKEEVENAEEEGVIFKLLNNPVAIIGDDKKWVKAIRCQRMELGEPDQSGRKKPVAVPGSEFDIEVNTVVIAIGQGANPLVASTTSALNTNKWGYIVTDERTGATSRPGVFAGGDIVTGAATVILAMGAGKIAARSIDRYLKDQPLLTAEEEAAAAVQDKK
ncbi:MAG: NADPH-dependent glutamate synthase [Candidatus Schekmanbacteria bacterium]|nr:NADPH-dependent glutamate synthase [Candidatus Schekmanbacteria bacterium]